MRSFFLESPWPGIVVWAVIYTSDFLLTIICARLYDRSIADKIVFEGSVELNPIFQKEVDSRKFVSPRFFLALVLSCTMTAIYWALAVPAFPHYYTAVLGGAICMELAIHVRHLGNLHMFSSSLTTEQLRGRIEYARPLLLERSSVQIFSFAILYAVLFAFTKSWFVAGGAFACFILSMKHWFLSRRAGAKRAKMAQSLPQET